MVSVPGKDIWMLGKSGQRRSKTVLLLTEGGRRINGWEAGFGGV